jgi:hypothetical protein
MHGVDGHGAGRHTEQAEMMAARMLFGRARAIGYIFSPSWEIVNDKVARFTFDTSFDFSCDTC